MLQSLDTLIAFAVIMATLSLLVIIVVQMLADAGFPLIREPLFSRWKTEEGNSVAKFFRHLLGMLFTAGLLSLGAPFWYNPLKNLTSLRPALAQIIGKEEAAAPQSGK